MVDVVLPAFAEAMNSYGHNNDGSASGGQGGSPTGPPGGSGGDPNGPPPSSSPRVNSMSPRKPHVKYSLRDDEEAPTECMESNREDVRATAVNMDNSEAPLCFTVAALFETELGEMSDPVCMYRCGWDQDCNYYMNLDDDFWEEMETESCAGMSDTRIGDGCYDMGFCDSWNEAGDQGFWMWPYDATNEQEVEWMSKIYYWIPFVPTEPVGCKVRYSVANTAGLDWEWDTEICDEYTIDDGACQSVIITPELTERNIDIVLKINAEIEGTRSARNFYQFFFWDWDAYNEYQTAMTEGGDDFVYDCPPDVPDCDKFEEYEEEWEEEWDAYA